MGIMKRIAGERMFNESLTGRRDNPELAAMHAIMQVSRGRVAVAEQYVDRGEISLGEEHLDDLEN